MLVQKVVNYRPYGHPPAKYTWPEHLKTIPSIRANTFYAKKTNSKRTGNVPPSEKRHHYKNRNGDLQSLKYQLKIYSPSDVKCCYKSHCSISSIPNTNIRNTKKQIFRLFWLELIQFWRLPSQSEMFRLYLKNVSENYKRLQSNSTK